MSVIASERSERGNLRDHFAALVMTDASLGNEAIIWYNIEATDVDNAYLTRLSKVVL
jgi:hypothetical protein